MFRLIGNGCLIWLICFATYAQTTQIHYLSGTDKENAAQWDFWIDKGRRAGSWQTINVPSCWEIEGFGTYNFDNPPLEEKAVYKHRFIALPAWQNRHINLVFEGVLTEAEVKLNGQLIGTHSGGYERFSFDISAYIQPGNTNELEVIVYKRKSKGQTTQWTFGGIYRPVYLEILPPIHITDVAADAQADGQLLVRVYVNRRENLQLRVSLQELTGNPVGAPLQSLTCKNTADNRAVFEVSGNFADIQPWSAELPQRYRLLVELQDEQGKVLHRIAQTVGFRTVALQDDGLYINNKKLRLQGTTYRPSWYESGWTVNKQISDLDGLLLKEMNANAVYAPFYLPDKHFLDVCDSLGLYVICPASALRHNFNHPSVILQTGQAIGSEVYNRVFVNPARLALLQQTDEKALKQAQQALDANRQIGVFLPQFADETFPDQNGEPLVATRGIVTAKRERSAIFYALRQLWSPLQIGTATLSGRFEGTLQLTNKFAFTNLNQCKITWQLAIVTHPLTGNTGQQIVAGGTTPATDIAPGATGKLPLNLPANWQEYDLLILTAFSPTGNEIYTWHFPITSPEQHIPQLLLGDFTEAASPQKTSEGWELTGGETKVTIAPEGHISRITWQGQILRWTGEPFKESPVKVISQSGSLKLIFPASSPVQTLTYTISDAGILRIAYSGNRINFILPPDLREISTFAAGPFPASDQWQAGISTSFRRQKSLQPANYNNLYWARFQEGISTLTLTTASEQVSMQVLPEGRLTLTNPPAIVILFIKVGD